MMIRSIMALLAGGLLAGGMGCQAHHQGYVNDAGCCGGVGCDQGCADCSATLGPMKHAGGRHEERVARKPHQAYPKHAGPARGAGPATPTVAYPYYTIRGPRDFLAGDPPSLGR